jgi:hypothetical protein
VGDSVLSQVAGDVVDLVFDPVAVGHGEQVAGE